MNSPPLPPLKLTFDAPGDPAGAPILLLAAMGVPARYYDSFTRALNELGHPVTRAHWRDEDRDFPIDHPEYGYADLAERDVPEAVASVREQFGADPIVVGHSLGGQIATIAAAKAGPYAGLVTIASGTNYWRGSDLLWAARVGLVSTAVVPAAARIFGYWPGGRLGFGGRQPARLIRDWARLGRSGRFEPEGRTFDLDAAIAEYDGPVLSISVSGDQYVTQGATDNLLRKLTGASSIERQYWTPEDPKQRGHFNWVRPGTEIARRVHEWAMAKKIITSQ